MAPWLACWPKLGCPGLASGHDHRGSILICPLSARPWRAFQPSLPPASMRWCASGVIAAAPITSATSLAAERGGNLRAIAAGLTRLLLRYGAAELQAAVIEALDRDVPHPNAVRFALERRRQERHQPPPIAVDLPSHVQARDIPVRPARLELYDQLKRSTDE